MISHKFIFKLLMVLFFVTISIFFTFFVKDYYQCRQVLKYLQNAKEDFSSNNNEELVSLIKNEIEKIRKTRKCNLPIVFSARIIRTTEAKDRFWVALDWLQKKKNQRRFTKLTLRFDHEAEKKEFEFDLPPSSPPIYENENIFGCVHTVCFVKDANLIFEGTPYAAVLPYEFSNSPIYVSLEDNYGETTDWIKCASIHYGNIE